MRRFARRHLEENAQRIAVERAGPTFFAMACELYENWPRLGAGVTAALLSRDEANFLAAIEMCRELPPQGAGLPCPSLGIATYLIPLYQALGQLETGERLSVQILEDPSWKKDPLGLANTLKARGDLEKERRNKDRALELYEAALGIYVKIEDALGLSNVLSEIAELHVDSGRNAGATDAIHKDSSEASPKNKRRAFRGRVKMKGECVRGSTQEETRGATGWAQLSMAASDLSRTLGDGPVHGTRVIRPRVPCGESRRKCWIRRALS